MRSVINISLPKDLEKVVLREVKRGKFASKSEYVRYLLRLAEEDRILKDIKQSEKEFAAGKGRVLRSLKDLR